MDKPTIRKKMLSLRSKMSRKEVETKSAEIAEKLFHSPVFKKSRRVMFYAAFKNEVETCLMIEKALRAKKEVFMPRVEGGEIVAVKISCCGELSHGSFGIKEPRGTAKPLHAPELKFDAIIIPGIAFDSECNRLGFGKGYYDRFLARAAGLKIGLAYGFQITEKLPVSKNDIKTDMVITEEKIFTPS